MGLMDFVKRVLGGNADSEPVVMSAGRFGLMDLSSRLGVSASQLQAIEPTYHRFELPKRNGPPRKIAAPQEPLKRIQGTILRRLLSRLDVHPAVRGFEPGHSIVTNALPHVGKAVVLRMDIREFFTSTTARRVNMYFRIIGWDAEAAVLLTKLCTLDGGLPQGAATSPRLSNLVNYRLDARLGGLAASLGAVYTRYADDMTFSFEADIRDSIRGAIVSTKMILKDFGYRLHQDKKLRVSRRHNRQLVTGLVVNESVNLPRSIRRRLRAVEHHLDNGLPATMTRDQLAGWQALRAMIANQASSLPGQ